MIKRKYIASLEREIIWSTGTCINPKSLDFTFPLLLPQHRRIQGQSSLQEAHHAGPGGIFVEFM